jgi:hypothetical protein
VLSLLQQYTIMRKNDAEIHLWRNLGVDKWKARLTSAKSLSTQLLAKRNGSTQRAAEAAGTAGPSDKGAKAKSGKAALTSPMTREQALRTLGLESDASAAEIEQALASATPGKEQALNGSDHAIAAKIDEARLILGGKGGA